MTALSPRTFLGGSGSMVVAGHHHGTVHTGSVYMSTVPCDRCSWPNPIDSWAKRRPEIGQISES